MQKAHSCAVLAAGLLFAVVMGCGAGSKEPQEEPTRAANDNSHIDTDLSGQRKNLLTMAEELKAVILPLHAQWLETSEEKRELLSEACSGYRLSKLHFELLQMRVWMHELTPYHVDELRRMFGEVDDWIRDVRDSDKWMSPKVVQQVRPRVDRIARLNAELLASLPSEEETARRKLLKRRPIERNEPRGN